MVPDHVPDLDCPAPWHAGNAYTIGFMKALTMNAQALGPARSQEITHFGSERQAAASR
jgi:mannonate dehydratase